MPQQGVLTNLNNQVFSKAYLYGSRSGGVTDAIQFGALQRVQFSHTFTKVEQNGPESLSPLGVAIGAETLTGTYQAGVITAEQFFMAYGGNMSYSGGTQRTTYTKLVNEEPKAFDLRIDSEDQGSNSQMQIRVFNCVADGWTMSLENRTWVQPEGSFRVYGESGGGRLYTFSFPGDLTNQS